MWLSPQSKVKCLHIVLDRGESLKLITTNQSSIEVMALIGRGPVIEVGGCFLCLGVKTPVGQAEMTVDSYITSDLRKTVMRRVKIGIIKETAWGDWWLRRGGWRPGGKWPGTGGKKWTWEKG